MKNAKFYNEHIIVMSDAKQLIFFDIYTNKYELMLFDFDIVKIFVVKERIILYDTRNNIFELVKNLESNGSDKGDCSNILFELNNVKLLEKNFLYQDNNEITALFVDEKEIIFINSSGFFKSIIKNIICKEYRITDKRINKIDRLDADVFASVTEDGFLLIIDNKNSRVLSEVKVRDYPLYAIGIYGKNIFCSGFDNRLINYEFANESINRKNQTDTHLAPVFEIIIQQDRIITVSEDNTIGIHWLKDKGFAFKRVILNNIISKSSGFYLALNCYNHLDIYKLKTLNEENHNQINVIKNKVNEHDYELLHRITTNSFIVDFDICVKTKHIILSTTEKGSLYNFDETNIEKIDNFEASYQVGIFGNNMIYNTYKRNINIVELNTFKNVKKILIDHFDEKFYVGDNYFALRKLKKFYDINFNEYVINCKANIEKVCFTEDFLYLLTRNESYSSFVDFEICKYDIHKCMIVESLHLRRLFRIDNMILTDNYIIFNDFENIHSVKFDFKEHNTKYIGGIIHGIFIFLDGILIIQCNTNHYYKNCNDNKQIKIKWKKKLINK
ncbi:hypothetical protein COBT_001701 [Conglomerata obtusa]